MKLAELTKGYQKAEATSTGAREHLGTEVRNITRAGYTTDGNPYVMVDKPVKVFFDGEFRNVNRIVLFGDDIDAFKGSFDMRADIVQLNGLQAKASISIDAYENAEGEGAVGHSTNIILDAKNTATLIEKCNRMNTGGNGGAVREDNPFN
jgi:hypothetical protein